jgi:HAD superfamily hydrolase (TIGR01509 family)
MSFRAWKEVFERHGSDLTLDAWIDAVGILSSFNPMVLLEKRLGRSLPHLYDEMRDIYRRLDADMPLRDGIYSLLQFARAHSVKIGVVSNSPRWWIETGLRRRGIFHFFDDIVSKENVALCKPHPCGYRLLLEHLRGDASVSIAFEDSSPGVTAAKAAGLWVVAAPNSVTIESDFSSADIAVDDLAALPLKWLESVVRSSNSAPIACTWR